MRNCDVLWLTKMPPNFFFPSFLKSYLIANRWSLKAMSRLFLTQSNDSNPPTPLLFCFPNFLMLYLIFVLKPLMALLILWPIGHCLVQFKDFNQSHLSLYGPFVRILMDRLSFILSIPIRPLFNNISIIFLNK